MKKVVIVGAGIHGVTTAIELAKNGYDVTIIDKNSDILMGTSGATHNRAHMGYHYPRSISTGKECIEGLTHFRKKHSQSIIYQSKSYYMIEKNSRSTMKEYGDFCRAINIPFSEQWPDDNLINKELLEGGIITNEPVFDIEKLKEELKRSCEILNVKIITNAELTKLHINHPAYTYKIYINGYHKVLGSEVGVRIDDIDIIINATYSHTNNVMKILMLNEDMIKYKLQHTEVVVVKSKIPLPSITIMDGPFVSIMKQGGYDDQYLLYDVKNSILEESEGYFMENKTFPTNYTNMLEHFRKYFKFVDELEYVDSWWGTRPIPIDNSEDARNTNIIEHHRQGIYSIVEGKFISATMIAEQLTKKIKDKELIHK